MASQEPQTDAVIIPLDWQIPDDLVTQYATNFVIQFDDHEVVLLFFEAWKPLLIGSPESIRNRAKEIESIPAKCIARIVLTPGRMRELYELFQRNANHILQQDEQQAEEEGH